MSTFTDIKQRVQTLIPSLTNDSNASIWVRLCQVFAGVIDTTNLNCSNSEKAIEHSARTLRVASRQYYIDMALAYQEGDDLVLLNPATYSYGYAEVDSSKQIIKQVAIGVNTPQSFTLSVAKVETDTVTPLTKDELTAFISYMELLTPLGIAIEISSNDPTTVDADLLTIRYDPSFSLDTIKSQVGETLIGQQMIIRGSTPLYVNDIESNFRNINGVVDAFFTNPYSYNGDSAAAVPASKGILQTQTGYFNFSTDLRDLSPSKVEFIIAE